MGRNQGKGNCRQSWQGMATGMVGGSCLLLSTINAQPVFAAGSLDEKTQQAMIDSINDEYHARAFYTAVIEKFGEVKPFTNIVKSEDNHVNLWVNIFGRYNLPIPADSYANNMEAPETLAEACKMAVEAEIANVKMYDDFLTFVEQPDLKIAFSRLREVSQERHLPAFQRCEDPAGQGRGQGGGGQGRGQGGGQGGGQGRGRY